MKALNTRIAPSPTGNMHIGTARTAYHNWLVAKATGGKFHLRIDNTDLTRSKDEYTEGILKSMEWLGLDYEQPIVYQTDTRKYISCANALLDDGIAREVDGAIVVNGLYKDKIPAVWHDKVVGDVTITQQDIDGLQDLVLIKSDGTPTYHFATVVDDFSMDINCIIRGVDHISNTIKHIYIYKLLHLDQDIPQYYHVGLLLGTDGKKISKRDGAACVADYKDQGYSREAFLNYILRMGWSPKLDNKENSVLSVDRAIEMILTEGNFRAAPAKLDPAKLTWYNKKHKR